MSGSIHIGRLELHLDGLSFRDAEALADGLAQEIMARVEANGLFTKKTAINRTERIDAGCVDRSKGLGVPELRGEVASKVVEAISLNANRFNK